MCVDMFVNWNQRPWLTLHCLEAPSKLRFQAAVKTVNPWRNSSGIFGIFGSIDKGDRTPGIAFTPLQDFVAGLQDEVGVGFERE